jgi:transposase
MNFFRKWVDGNLTESHLAYDVSSFSSYAKGLKEAEWGFNRDGDKLPQINLGCYLSHTGGIPLFYVTYHGSIVDKAQLPYMMAYNEELGIKDIKFILDRGFCTTSNLQELHSMAIQYVMAVNSFHKTTRSAIDEVREDITLLRYRLNEGTYGKTINSRFYGVKSNMHVYYSTVTAERQREDLLRLVEKRGENLKHIKQLTAKEINFYSKFHDIAINTDNTISYTLNYDKIEKEAMYCGFYCILSNTSSNTKQIYNIYKQRDIIEKGFDDIKNHIDMKRLHTHNDETTNGKLFCAFIALIVTSQMTEPLRTINKSSGKGHLSRPGLLLELEKIKVLIYPRTRRLLNPLTKKQREILAAFGLSEKELKSYASCPE